MTAAAEANRLFDEIDTLWDLKDAVMNALPVDPWGYVIQDDPERLDKAHAEAARLTQEIFNRLHRLEALGVEIDFEALNAGLKAIREQNKRKYSS